MPGEVITVTQKGIPATQTRTQKVAKVIGDPDMNVIVRAMARVWQSNFESEGGMVGGWRPLTESTNDLRQSRGYPRAHPILVQSGGLKRAAITSLLNVQGPRWQQEKNVMTSWQPSKLHGTLTISGPKVDNQFRVRDRRNGISSPPRPFWFVNPRVELAAAYALTNWIHKEAGI